MIPGQLIFTLYFTFTLLCVMPWAFNWAIRGRMPVVARLLALLVFFWTLASSTWFLWTVPNDIFRKALTLVFPMMFVSLVGTVLVGWSLVKIVRHYAEN